MESESHLARSSHRDLAIDRLRGALVIVMVTGDYIAGIDWIPAWLKHAPDIGFTIADLVAPMFVFVIGLNFGPSFRKRTESSKYAGYLHFLKRYLSLLGLGAIITAGGAFANRPTGWGVLESLGVAGLITLIFIRLPIWFRFVIGFAILAAYQYFLDATMLQNVLTTGHGGPYGAISWSALLLLSTAVADLWRKGLSYLVLSTSLISISAMVATFFVPISKNRVSLSYVLLTLAISCIVFVALKTSNSRSKQGILCWWGRNSLVLYLLHLLLLAVFELPEITWWYSEAPVWLMLIQLAAILGIMSLVARQIKDVRLRVGKRSKATAE